MRDYRDFRIDTPAWVDDRDRYIEHDNLIEPYSPITTVEPWCRRRIHEPPRNACGRTEEEERSYQTGHKIIEQRLGRCL